MKVPDDWPKPPPRGFTIRCVNGWGSGWYLYNSEGRVFKSGGLAACLVYRRFLESQRRDYPQKGPVD